MDDDGDFVVVWQSLQQDGLASTESSAQRFDCLRRAALGAEFQVNTFTAYHQFEPVGSDGRRR